MLNRVQRQFGAWLLVTLATLVLSACGGGNTDPAEGGNQPTEPLTPRGWELVWSDEFEGNALNASKWNIQLGDGTTEGIPGWGNNELQSYREGNISVAGGDLIITAQQEAADGREYTSARINTSRKLDVKYGRVEANIQTPSGQGLWSAFWMLPTDSPYGGWAAGGEIDIMEVFSRDPAPFTQAAVHYGMAWPLNVFNYKKYDQFDPSAGFHTYALEWDEQEMRWFVDGIHYHTVTNSTYWNYYKDTESNAHAEGGASAPFDSPFHLLLNLAVGGNLPGDPVPSALPGELRVDYVRVYTCNIDPGTGTGCEGFADRVDPSVTPRLPDSPFRTEYVLYEEGAGPLTFPGVEDTLALNIGVYDNNGALGVSEVDSGDDQGVVMDIFTRGGGNISLHAANTSRLQLFGMGDASHPGNFAGELQFDLYVYSAETDSSSAFQVKLDSGFPDLGFVEIPFSEVPSDEWTTVTVQISDLAHSGSPFGGAPLDLSNVLSLFVLEPTGSAHLRVDNIKIACGHPEDAGCGITPPAPPPPASTEPFDVYIDSVNPIWNLGIIGADSGSGWVNYTDGANPANKSQWRELTDPARGQILEVSFSGGAEFGVWFMQSSAGVDLSAYAAGSVSFDIKVENYAADSPGMTMKVDCVFPCTSGDQAIGRVGDGEWETVMIPVVQLLGGGLNLATVNTGLVIFPTSQSAPVTFLLDNVKWVPAEDTGPPTGGGAEIEIFAEAVSPDWFGWDCCGGATFNEVSDDDAGHGNVVELAFNGVGTVTGFQAVTSVDASGLASGTLEFDFKQLAPPPEGSQWRLKLESTDAATFAEVVLTHAGNPQPGPTWQSYSFRFDSDLAGLDLANLKLIMIFPDWENSAGAVARIDNVRLVASQ